jgi:death on curing protein
VTEWVAPAVALAVHDEQIAEHGGAPGVRDLGLLQSALHRPQNLEAHGNPDIADLAAAYAFGIARNHPFVDGNKRSSAVIARTFLRLNGFEINASQADTRKLVARADRKTLMLPGRAAARSGAGNACLFPAGFANEICLGTLRI